MVPMCRSCKVTLPFVLAALAGLAPARAGADPALPAYWWSRGIGGGGAFFAPGISPYDRSRLFVATDMGVLYRSDDGGALWNVYAFGNLQGGRLAKVQFTSDPRVLYVLDGRVDYAEYLGGAIMRSVDGGASWSRLANDPVAACDAARKKLRADPGAPGRLVLGHDRGLWFSADGGTNWTAFHAPAAGDGCYLADVVFCGADIFAAGNFGMYVSADNGATFAPCPLDGIGGGEKIAAFAGGARDGAIRLYCITTDSATADGLDDGYRSPAEAIYGTPAAFRGLYSRDWPSGAWIPRTAGLRSGETPAFVACPLDRPDVVYAAGQNNYSGYPAIYCSTDAATNWTAVFDGVHNRNIQTGWEGCKGDLDWYWGGGALGFAVSPADPDCAVFSDWGFVHATTNRGVTWQALYVPPAERHAAGADTPRRAAYHGIGLENTTCWWLTWLDADTLFASFTDIGALRSTNGGAAWIPAIADVNVNTVYCCVTDAVGRAYIATSTIHDLYGSTRLQDNPIDSGGGGVLCSADRGATWLTLHDFGHPVVWLEIHPADQNVMYASVVHSDAGGIYVTSNLQAGAAAAWTRLAAPPRTEGHPLSIRALSDGTLVCSYSGRRDAGGKFTHSSGVFVSTDGGATWTDRSAAGMRCWTKDLVVHPLDARRQTWFACVFEAWGSDRPIDAGGVYRTTDGGRNWHHFWPELLRVDSITFHPADMNAAFVTTESMGLYFSTNMLAANPTCLPVTNYPFCHPVRVFANPHDTNEVWATSFGNGLRVGWLREPAPRLDRPAVHDGVATLTGRGRDGQRLRLESSANLAAWSAFATNAVAEGVFTGRDTTAGAAACRFYRAVLTPQIIGP